MIYYFNPGHEVAVLNGSKFYMAPANTKYMKTDLAYLPLWYAGSNSYTLVNEIDKEYISYLKENLEFTNSPILAHQINELSDKQISVWGVTPQVIHFLENLQSDYEVTLSIPTWHDEYVALNGRQTAQQCLIELQKQIPNIATHIIPQFYSNLSEVEEAVAKSSVQLLAKSPYSSSGKGLLRLPIGELTRTERQNLQGMFNKQSTISLEPLHNKLIDFAMEFESDGNGNVSFCGYSLFTTSAKGAYLGNYLYKQDKIVDILSEKVSNELLLLVQERLSQIMARKYAHLYKGVIGVDMIVYEEEGINKLHPCIEINMRYNMGHLSYMAIDRHLNAECNGIFKVEFFAQDGDCYTFHQTMQKEHPATFANKKLTKGYLSLCPVYATSKYLAYLLVD